MPMKAYDIVTAHDTLFYAGTTGKFYMSIDNGLNWSFIGDRLPSGATSLVNAKQALIMSRHLFEGSLKTIFYYIKKDSLLNPFVNFSVVGDSHFTYDLAILGNRLWDASNKGLFFMSLSDLPGITATNDVTPIILPVRFTALNARCKDSQEIISWKTDQEQNSDNFTIERSIDRINWISIGSEHSIGGSAIEHSYAFTDNHSVQNSYYRIAQNDFDGKKSYSAIVRSSCSSIEGFTSWPNPFIDILTVNIYSDTPANVSIKIIDSRGAVVKSQRTSILRGSNQLSVDTKSLSRGFYHLSASWGNHQMQRSMKVVKL
jgi:hypothetical protein